MTTDVVICAALRTPVGKFGGGLSSFTAAELGSHVIRALLEQTGLFPDTVDEVIMGHVLTGGCGQNPARQAAIGAGLPDSVPAMTVNKVCGSGMKSIHLAAQAIRCGDAELIIAGGQESMSQAPHVLPGSRTGRRMGDWTMKDSMILDGLWDAFNGYHMGCTAENVAEKYGISRDAQDEFAAGSQHKADEARQSGRFSDEIVPVGVRHPKTGETVTVADDEGPRPETTAKGLSRLKPAFQSGGSVTPGNASGLNDGAAAVVVCSESRARALGLPVLCRIEAYASAAVDPAIMGIGPVPATRRCLEKAGWSADTPELIEANEAFAAQSLAVLDEMGWDPARLNVNGGAIALGHPIGASGARILVTLLHEMRRRDSRTGLATLCIGGGQGIATAVSRD